MFGGIFKLNCRFCFTRWRPFEHVLLNFRGLVMGWVQTKYPVTMRVLQLIMFNRVIMVENNEENPIMVFRVIMALLPCKKGSFNCFYRVHKRKSMFGGGFKFHQCNRMKFDIDHNG